MIPKDIILRDSRFNLKARVRTRISMDDVWFVLGYQWSQWKIVLCSYNTIKSSIQGGNSKKPLGPSMHMFAAADAGVLTLLMTNPIWVVKTRLCLQYASDVNMAESKKYHGMVDALSKIYKTEGIRGLYKVSEVSFPAIFDLTSSP